MTRRLLLAVLLVAFAASAPAASAHPARCHRTHHHRCRRPKPKPAAPKVWPNRIPEAVVDAEVYWGGRPPCGQVTVDEKPLPPGPVNGGPGNFAARIARGDLIVLAWVEEGAGSCTIHLNPASLWGIRQLQDEEYHWFCDTITHELGHLFGHSDAGETNPALITYPLVEPGLPNFDAVPECRIPTSW